MPSAMVRKSDRSSQAGFTLVELMIAGALLVVGALTVMGMIAMSIATNSRNKVDSTKTMLGEAVIEEVSSTLIGSGSANLTDCSGNNFSINAAAGGAKLQGGGTHPSDTLGSDIDFNESTPPAGYQMDYVVMSPCSSTGQYIATYDVRWHVDQIGESGSTPTNSFLLTVGARKKGASPTGSLAGVYFSFPVNMRVVIGRPE